MRGVIADSDDESDGGSYTATGGRDDVQAMIKTQLDERDEAGHATSSTDPAFFHSVLMQQSNAAGHQKRFAQEDFNLSEWNRHENDLAPTATAATVQPGVQEPLPTMGSSFYPPTAPTKLAILPQTESQADPYDVPSSPEQHAKATLQQRAQKLSRGHKSSENNEADGADVIHLARNAKRRRTAEGYEGGETVEIVHIPSSSPLTDSGGDESNEVGIHAPMETDHSVSIAANHLSASQKMEYQSVELPSSPTQQSTSAPLPITRNCPIESSLGTNINTQRSIAMARREPSPTQVAPVEEVEPLKRRPGRPKKEVAPIVTSGEPRSQRKKVTKSYERVLEDSDGEGDDWLGPARNADDDEVNEASPVKLPDESPVQAKSKTKGKRGRPKKRQEPKVVEDDLDTGKQVNLDERTPAKAKRGKRGRPKKIKEEAAAIPVSGLDDENQASVETGITFVAKNEIKEEIKDISQVRDDDEEEEQNQVSISEPAKEESIAQQEPEPDERKPLATTTNNEKKASKQLTVGGAGVGKPFYRVGLSRRTSIAPLLKIIRK